MSPHDPSPTATGPTGRPHQRPELAPPRSEHGVAARRVFHITTRSDADRLLRTGRLDPPSLATEGFVHCSTAGQVVVSTERHLAGVTDLVLVELDPDRLDDLRWPEVYPREWFPHLHGPVLADHVIAVHPWDQADRDAWPGHD